MTPSFVSFLWGVSLTALVVTAVRVVITGRRALREGHKRRVAYEQSKDALRIARAKLRARRASRHLPAHGEKDPLQALFGVEVPTEFKPSARDEKRWASRPERN